MDFDYTPSMGGTTSTLSSDDVTATDFSGATLNNDSNFNYDGNNTVDGSGTVNPDGGNTDGGLNPDLPTMVCITEYSQDPGKLCNGTAQDTAQANGWQHEESMCQYQDECGRCPGDPNYGNPLNECGRCDDKGKIDGCCPDPETGEYPATEDVPCGCDEQGVPRTPPGPCKDCEGNDVGLDECGNCPGTEGYQPPDECERCPDDSDYGVSPDCNGDCGGTAEIDECGDCWGGNTGRTKNQAKDCNDECGGSAQIDDCGDCYGGTTGRTENQSKDECGVCDGPGLNEHGCCGDLEKDCADVCGGSAVEDECGECNGSGREDCKDCDGQSFVPSIDHLPTTKNIPEGEVDLSIQLPWVPGSDDPDYSYDVTVTPAGELEAAITAGGQLQIQAPSNVDDDTAYTVEYTITVTDPERGTDCGSITGTIVYTVTDETIDCNGDQSGDAYLDECGNCVGGNTGNTENYAKDDCGVCDGDNTSCADCAGTPNGSAVVDECGNCDGDPGYTPKDPSTNCCPDGEGPGGEAADCAGECGGSAVVDECGECNGPGLNEHGCCGDQVKDCAGVCGGSAVVDECGVCDGPGLNEHGCCGDQVKDCNGICGGSAVEDECGVCDGDNSTCLDCDGVPNGSAYLDDCGDCVGGTTGLEANHSKDECGRCPGDTNYNDVCFDCDETPAIAASSGEWVTINMVANSEAEITVSDYVVTDHTIIGALGTGTNRYVENSSGVLIHENNWTSEGLQWPSGITLVFDESTAPGGEWKLKVVSASGHSGVIGLMPGLRVKPDHDDDGNPDGGECGASVKLKIVISSIPGCTNPSACNYDPSATEDDGSCYFAEEHYDCAGNCIDADDCGRCQDDPNYDDGCLDCSNETEYQALSYNHETENGIVSIGDTTEYITIDLAAYNTLPSSLSAEVEVAQMIMLDGQAIDSTNMVAASSTTLAVEIASTTYSGGAVRVLEIPYRLKWNSTSGSSPVTCYSSAGENYDGSVRIAYRQDCICTQEYDPVCVNGVTYSNPCRARCEGYTSDDWEVGPCNTETIIEVEYTSIHNVDRFILNLDGVEKITRIISGPDLGVDPAGWTFNVVNDSVVSAVNPFTELTHTSGILLRLAVELGDNSIHNIRINPTGTRFTYNENLLNTRISSTRLHVDLLEPECESGYFDECGVCDGPGILPDECDCDGQVLDCAGDCGGTKIENECGECAEPGSHEIVADECGECGGDGTACQNTPVAIKFASYEEIYGFQFSISGVTLNIDNSPYGGAAAAAGFTVYQSDSSVILGFSHVAAFIPQTYGEESTLVNLTVTGLNTNVEINNVVVSNAAGEAILAQVIDGVIVVGEEPSYGCTDIDACNYDDTANIDDGSCIYEDDCGDCDGDNTSCATDVTIKYRSDASIVGFRFAVQDSSLVEVSVDEECIIHSGGEHPGWSVIGPVEETIDCTQYTMVIGASMPDDEGTTYPIPDGENVLIKLRLTNPNQLILGLITFEHDGETFFEHVEFIPTTAYDDPSSDDDSLTAIINIGLSCPPSPICTWDINENLLSNAIINSGNVNCDRVESFRVNSKAVQTINNIHKYLPNMRSEPPLDFDGQAMEEGYFGENMVITAEQDRVHFERSVSDIAYADSLWSMTIKDYNVCWSQFARTAQELQDNEGEGGSPTNCYKKLIRKYSDGLFAYDYSSCLDIETN